jgi:hypothetical protein
MIFEPTRAGGSGCTDGDGVPIVLCRARSWILRLFLAWVFETVKQVGRYTFYNEVTASRVMCP